MRKNHADRMGVAWLNSVTGSVPKSTKHISQKLEIDTCLKSLLLFSKGTPKSQNTEKAKDTRSKAIEIDVVKILLSHTPFHPT